MISQLTRRETSTPRRWFEMGPVSSLRDEMDQLFESFFGNGDEVRAAGRLVPNLDLSETPEAVEVKTDLPGFKPDEVNIEVGDNVLTISGTHTAEKETKEDARKYHRIERRSGSFSRSIRLPCVVQDEKIAAELCDGVLSVTLPKSEKAKTRKIRVKG